MPRLVLKNRVRVTTTTTGTGPYTVGPASAGYQDFAGYTNGQRFPYTAQYGSNWEVGIGEKQGTQILRYSVLESTNGNAAVNWGVGSKYLFIDQIAEQVVVSPDGSLTINDNFTTGETEIEGFNTQSLVDGMLAGVDIELVPDDIDDPTTLTIHNTRKIATVADSATITLNFAASPGSTKLVSVAGNRTIEFANARTGQEMLVQLNYDLVGGRVVTWPTEVEWVNGYTPAYTPNGGGSDTFKFQKVGATYLGWILSTERPVILTGEATSDVEVTLDIVDGVANGPNEFQWLTATIDSDYNDYTITKTGTVSGGTFDLTIGLSPGDNQTITNIPYNVTAFGLLTLIWANTILDETEINVDGLVDGAGSARTISGDGSLHFQFIGGARYAGYVITADSTNLTGGGTYEVSSTGEGSGSDPWPFTGASYAGRTMKFRYNGVDSAAVAVNADAATIQTAIGAIAGIGAGNISVKRLAIGSYYFEFISSLSGTNIPYEIQFSPSFLPSSSLGNATGQLYSTARNGTGPVGSNEINTITITGGPSQGSVTLTVFPGEPEEATVLIPIDATSGQVQTLMDAAIGVDNSEVTGGPLPDTPIVIEFIGEYVTTNVVNSTIDGSGAGASDIDWSICEGKVITLLPGSGEYVLRHVRPIPGKTLFVTLISDGATGTIVWTDAGIGVPVNWGTAGAPTIPADTESLYLEFYAETVNDIHGRLWFGGTGSGGSGNLETDLLPGYSIEIDHDVDEDTFTVHNYLTSQTLTPAPSVTIDLAPNLGADKVITLDQDTSFSITNEVVGKEFSLQVFQGDPGSFDASFVFDIEWAEGFEPVQTPVVGKSDLWHFLCLAVAVGSTPARFRGWVETTERPQPNTLTVMASTSTGSPGNIEDLPSLPDIRALWHHEESGSADRLDSVGSLNLVKTVGIISSVSGIRGQATNVETGTVLNVDDSTGTVTFGDEDFSLVTWVKVLTRPVGGSAELLRNLGNVVGSGYGLDLLTNGKINFRIIDGSSNLGQITTTSAIPLDGEFHLITAVLDSVANLIKISVDGETLNTAAHSFGAGADDGTIRLQTGDGTSEFVVDEQAIIGTALDQDDVDFLWDGGSFSDVQEIDWSICDNCDLLLEPGNGTYYLSNIHVIDGKTLHLQIESDNATGIIDWSLGVSVDWGEIGPPQIPISGQKIHLELYAVSQISIIGKFWFNDADGNNARFIARTAAQSVVTHVVGTADESYVVSANVLVTTSTTHSFTVTVAYTDEGGTTRTLTLPFTILAGTFVTAITNAAGTVPYAGTNVCIRAKAGTSITVASVGTFTSVTYNIEANIRKLV